MIVFPKFFTTWGYIFFAIVLLPDPDSPVNQTKTPLFFFVIFYFHNYLIKLIISLIGVIFFSTSKDLPFLRIALPILTIEGYAALSIWFA